MKKECLNCKKEFDSTHGNMKFCSIECKHINQKHQDCDRYNNGEEGVDYVICKLCNNKVKRVYGIHLKLFHKGVTSIEYKKMFPGELLHGSIDKHNISKNGGKFMKEDKWRKWASDKMKGELNINHKTKATEEERKQRSPFSKEFYKKQNKTEEDRQLFCKTALKDREFNTTISYYINRGYTKDEAKVLVKDRQITFSKEKCILKYGEDEGLKRWNLRQEKWLKNYKHNNYSKVSQVLFKQIYEKIKLDFSKIYFATIVENNENNEYRLRLNNKTIMPDFYIEDNKKIIEFDGAYWHRINNIENERKAEERDDAIIKNGFTVLHIREDDFYKKPKDVLKSCIDFIYS